MTGVDVGEGVGVGVVVLGGAADEVVMLLLCATAATDCSATHAAAATSSFVTDHMLCVKSESHRGGAGCEMLEMLEKRSRGCYALLASACASAAQHTPALSVERFISRSIAYLVVCKIVLRIRRRTCRLPSFIVALPLSSASSCLLYPAEWLSLSFFL